MWKFQKHHLEFVRQETWKKQFRISSPMQAAQTAHSRRRLEFTCAQQKASLAWKSHPTWLMMTMLPPVLFAKFCFPQTHATSLCGRHDFIRSDRQLSLWGLVAAKIRNTFRVDNSGFAGKLCVPFRRPRMQMSGTFPGSIAQKVSIAQPPPVLAEFATVLVTAIWDQVHHAPVPMTGRILCVVHQRFWLSLRGRSFTLKEMWRTCIMAFVDGKLTFLKKICFCPVGGQ